VLKLASAARRGERAVTQTRLRHILIRASERVEAGRRGLRDLRDLIVNSKADFAELARVHSYDGTRAAARARLGLSRRYVPDFERAYEELKEARSASVRTLSVYHLIQFSSGARPSMNPERRRCRRGRSAEASPRGLQEWLRQLRDQSYVEVRLDEK